MLFCSIFVVDIFLYTQKNWITQEIMNIIHNITEFIIICLCHEQRLHFSDQKIFIGSCSNICMLNNLGIVAKENLVKRFIYFVLFHSLYFIYSPFWKKSLLEKYDINLVSVIFELFPCINIYARKWYINLYIREQWKYINISQNKNKK